MKRAVLITLAFFFFLPSIAFAGPLDGIADAVGGTASAIGDSVGKTYDSVTGKRTPDIVRNEMDQEERKALGKLFQQQPAAKRLFDQSYGYAVFDSSKKGLLISSASGVGVAVTKGSGQREYMRMASLGANLGGGIQYYNVVFLFENQATMRSFVEKGWEASGGGSAVFGKDAVNADVKFVAGKAIFILNDTGLMLGADISGTKYWRDSKLNGKG